MSDVRQKNLRTRSRQMIPIATPREIGQRPGVMTMDMPGWDIAPRASGCRLCGRDQEGDLGVRLVDLPGVQLERRGFWQQMGKRVSNLHRMLKSQFF